LVELLAVGVGGLEERLLQRGPRLHHQQLALAAGGLGAVARVNPSSAAGRKQAGSLVDTSSAWHASQTITSRALVFNSFHLRQLKLDV
jgi:hypothetical protein